MSKHCTTAYTVQRFAVVYALFVRILNVYELCGLLECDIEIAGWRSQTTSIYIFSSVKTLHFVYVYLLQIYIHP